MRKRISSLSPHAMGQLLQYGWPGNVRELQNVIQQLESCEGKINLAARICGIDVKTLYRKMREHGLDKRDFRQRHTEAEI